MSCEIIRDIRSERIHRLAVREASLYGDISATRAYFEFDRSIFFPCES
jgi:hypothetical protein